MRSASPGPIGERRQPIGSAILALAAFSAVVSIMPSVGLADWVWPRYIVEIQTPGFFVYRPVKPTGLAMLVIPGGGLNAAIPYLSERTPFNPMTVLSDEFRCITMDLRNAVGGRSSGPVEVYHYALQLHALFPAQRDVAVNSALAFAMLACNLDWLWVANFATSLPRRIRAKRPSCP